MDSTTLLWVAGGGALGAYSRYTLSALASSLLGKNFPYGTLFVNVLGSCIMGILAACIKSDYLSFSPWHDFIAEGFLGALTTFSTFSMDTFSLFSKGEIIKAVLNVALSMTFCLLAVAVGFYLVAGAA